MTTTSRNDHEFPRTLIRRTVHLGSTEVEVTRLAPVPTSQQVTVDDEVACVSALEDATEAGLLPGVPPESLGRALARVSIDEPHMKLARIRSGIVIDLTDSADVATMRTALSPLTCLPGEQPRGGSAGGRPGQVQEPTEGRDRKATRLGLRVLVFDDAEHLRAWCADALARSLTRARKRGRPEEIAATGVRRPVSAAMTLLKFRDGTGAQWVPMLGDGISRSAVCGAALCDEFDGDPVVAADAVSRLVLAPLSTLTARSPAHELARKMRRNHDQFVGLYEGHVDEDGADEAGVRMRQFLRLPADLHLLASDPETNNPHPMDTAVEAFVSDLHTGVDGWDREDDSRHTALRALKQLRRDGVVNADLFALCSNRTDPAHASELATQPPSQVVLAPVTSPGANTRPRLAPSLDQLLLRRAVTIMAALLSPDLYPTFKNALRNTSGRKRLTMSQVVDYIAPLVCEPWGTLKPITRAWAYGGPVPTWARDVTLAPRHPEDYLTLVGIANDPATPEPVALAARLELALAGGTALIADGVLTTALVGGSGSTTTPLAFRGHVNAAVDALTCSTEGLTSLALAANHFRPSRSARSARLPGIDMTRPDRVARDGVGVPVRVTETVLAGYAGQALRRVDAAATSEVDESEGGPDQPNEPTPLQNLQSRARHLPAGTRSLLRDLELTKALHDETGGPCGLTEHDLDTVHDSLSRALKLAGRLT